MRRLVLLAAVLALGGCDLSMTRQPRREPQGSPSFWTDGPAAGQPPAGSVAQDRPATDAALATPPHVTPALIARGAGRYAIFCTPCHGPRGDGGGMIVQRGFPRPPDYREPRLVAAPTRHIVAVIGGGWGVMYGFADRIAPADRWAIAAYVRALQRTRGDPASLTGALAPPAPGRRYVSADGSAR